MSTMSSIPDPSQPVITERDMVSAFEILGGATADPEADAVATLTDEELIALGTPEATSLLGAPFLDQGIDPAVSSATALRSFIARRLVSVDPDTWEPEGEIVLGSTDAARRPFQADRLLTGLVTLRRIPEAMLVATRALSGGTTTLAHYVYAGGGVLEEFISTDGMHTFTALMLPAVAERLQAFVDPFSDATADGDPRTVEGDAGLESLRTDRTRAVTTVAAVSEGDGPRIGLFASEGELIAADLGQVGADTAAAQVAAVSSESLRALLDELVASAQPAAQDPSAQS